MSRKSQVEKFLARQGKAKKDEEAVTKLKPKNITEKGADMMKTVKPGTKTEDIVAAITHEGMSTFMKLWNNSMENVIRETIQKEVRAIVQEEMTAAIQGAVAGVTQAITEFKPFEPVSLDIDALLDKEEYVETGTPQHEALNIEAEKTEVKKPRYSKPRVMHCSVCKEEGHNKRNCPNKEGK